MATIRERAVQWLIDNPGEFTVNRFAVELALERRQALNALHGLKHGLNDQLRHNGSGHWSYAPTAVLVTQPADFGDDGPTSRVPLGWVGKVRVIARVGSEYLGQVLGEDNEPNGLHLTLTPVTGGIERLEPVPC